MYNTIILQKGEACLTNAEMKKFEKGDTIMGTDYSPEELKRWSIEQEDVAKEELAKYRCYYHSNGILNDIEEYALEYCECDEDGEFVQGSNFEFAEQDYDNIFEEKKELIEEKFNEAWDAAFGNRDCEYLVLLYKNGEVTTYERLANGNSIPMSIYNEEGVVLGKFCLTGWESGATEEDIISYMRECDIANEIFEKYENDGDYDELEDYIKEYYPEWQECFEKAKEYCESDCWDDIKAAEIENAMEIAERGVEGR